MIAEADDGSGDFAETFEPGEQAGEIGFVVDVVEMVDEVARN